MSVLLWVALIRAAVVRRRGQFFKQLVDKLLDLWLHVRWVEPQPAMPRLYEAIVLDGVEPCGLDPLLRRKARRWIEINVSQHAPRPLDHVDRGLPLIVASAERSIGLDVW